MSLGGCWQIAELGWVICYTSELLQDSRRLTQLVSSVIANYLPNAVFGTPRADGAAPDTAIATFNVRGVGQSGGSMPLPGFGIGNDGEDFAAVERAVADLVGGQAELYRLVSGLIRHTLRRR